MIPCLYDSREMKFDNNGIGKLADAQSCTVTEKRNGSYELKLICPADGIHAEMLEEGNVILAKPSDTMQPQPFRIYKITTPIDGKLEVQARHISYQLNFITVSPFSVSGCAGAVQGLKSHAASDCPFSVWTDVASSAMFTVSVPASFRNCLGGMDGSVLDTFGGEFEWDRYTVKFHRARGADHKLFRASAEDRIVKRVGIVLKAGGYKELEVDAEERLIDDSILSFPCLFDYLSKIPDIENGHADRWLSCIEHGLAGNRYLVIAALKYVLSLRKESISENIRTQLESMIKGSYNKWKKKKIRCLHCKEEVFIKPNGFCPKCSVGTELPTKYFIEALVSFSSFTMEEYIHLCSHPMSDVSAIAKRELQKIWIAAPNKLEYVIDNFEKLEYDGCIFELILQLPSQITCPYGMALKRLGMEISEEMQLIWLGNLRSLEWISAECMKTMVCESLSDESDAIRNKAMKCWLGEKDFWWENFA